MRGTEGLASCKPLKHFSANSFVKKSEKTVGLDFAGQMLGAERAPGSLEG